MSPHYAAILVLLLGSSASLTAAALEQHDSLRAFVQSRAGNTLADEDTWADPASSFRHLPARCTTPPAAGARAADKIAALPGQPPRVNFEQYSGYVTVDEAHGRALFYYFVESPYDAASKPLVLWLNGGPGCSSLGAGAMRELGPFRVNPDGRTLSRNKHAWNNLANVIFLESPAGVGFSYSNTSSDYGKSGDKRTAEDAYVFLLGWLERFPEYKGRDFYIAGESYGGHYVPQLATVIEIVREFGGGADINLKGIMVGNPYLDDNKNTQGQYEFLWTHGLISDEVWADINHGRPAYYSTGNIDEYNIYAPVCTRSRNGTIHSTSYLPGYDPCIEYYVPAYFNHPQVQKAMHARTTNWSTCVGLLWKDAPVSMVPTISRLVNSGLRVWLYSGDMDAVCPITATRYSVKDLKLAVTKPWRPWYTPDNEVGGYAQEYEGRFTFASVRGAGHLVPSFQPKRSLVLLYSFLKGVLPPAVSVWRP